MDGEHTHKIFSVLVEKIHFRNIMINFQMEGTLLNNKSQISPRTAEALKEAVSRGVRIVIATGKVQQNCFRLL